MLNMARKPDPPSAVDGKMAAVRRHEHRRIELPEPRSRDSFCLTDGGLIFQISD